MLLALLACVGQGTEPFGEPCHVAGYDTEVRCGTVDSQGISLRVVVVPTARAVSDTPLFFLAGGPGQAATQLVGGVMPALRGVNEERDLVFVDQRGTGASAPLECPEGDDSLASRFSAELLEDDCLPTLDADTTQFVTPIAMDDLDNVRAALGYEQIQLFGGSYGTRAALVYARRHPERLERMVLDGVVPTNMTLYETFAVDGQASMERLYEDAPATRGDIEAILARLPEEATVQHPRTGETETLTIEAEVFAAQLRGLMYQSALRAMVPWTLSRAEEGDWTPFVAETTALSDSVGLSVGMHLAVVCSEDVPRFTGVDLSATMLGDSLVRLAEKSCADWPRAELPAGYHEPVSWDGPVLLLSGELDPATPPRWAEEAAKTLPNSTHHVIPNTGHGTLSVPCVARQIEAFLEGEATEACSPAASPFFVDRLGP